MANRVLCGSIIIDMRKTEALDAQSDLIEKCDEIQMPMSFTL